MRLGLAWQEQCLAGDTASLAVSSLVQTKEDVLRIYWVIRGHAYVTGGGLSNVDPYMQYCEIGTRRRLVNSKQTASSLHARSSTILSPNKMTSWSWPQSGFYYTQSP